VLRVIPMQIRTVEELVLPPVLNRIADEERGLVLVTGTTGSGKSTTLAAMVDHVNKTRCAHIMTVEDPIEFLHRDYQSIINQREVAVDTRSFAQALRSALRQDPDVILVGEMRDFETIARIVSAFPPHQQKQVRLQLGSVLRGVVSQRLVPRADGKGRVAAVEVLVCNSRVREMIEDKERTKEIVQAISQSYTTYGMQTFDQSLMILFKQNIITYEEALRQCSNPDDFALRVSGISATSDSSWDSFEGGKDETQTPGGGKTAPSSRPGAPAPRPAPAAAGAKPATSGAPLGKMTPAPTAAPAKPASTTPPADDDFQIERF